ncbi:MAG: response regulator transcription factor [Vicinamibacterales bacterium]|nr:response regulator transcription factor [Vicinamibacterales bacterium]
MPIRVALVEDHARLRDDYTSIVAGDPGLTLVGAFATAEAALDHLPGLEPDAVLMDINLPGMNGIECARRLKVMLPAAQIVMLTAFDDGDQVFESLKAGATGYVLKDATAGEVLDAVRDVCAGGSPISSAIARKLVQYFSPRPAAPEVTALTAREREVLDALSRGLMYKEIADELGVSINTVRAHVRRIYETLHVQSRQDAVAKLGRPDTGSPFPG